MSDPYAPTPCETCGTTHHPRATFLGAMECFGALMRATGSEIAKATRNALERKP